MTLAPKFMWSWPSLLVESLSALGLTILFLWLPIPIVRWVLKLVLSILYEGWIDDAFSWRDVLQRMPVLVAGEVWQTLSWDHGHLWLH